MLRKVQYAPETDEPVEPVTRSRDFVTADKPLHLEVTLEKDVSGAGTLKVWTAEGQFRNP